MGGADDGTPGTGARPARHGHGSKEAAIRPGPARRSELAPRHGQAKDYASECTGAEAHRGKGAGGGTGTGTGARQNTLTSSVS